MRIGHKSTNTNIFMNMIHEKPKKGLFKIWKYKWEVKKFRNSIKNGSPGFGLLWRMADFIKLAEDCFFFPNVLDNLEFGLYSSRSYSKGQNGFKLYDNEVVITIKLISDSERVIMEIDRVKTANIPGVTTQAKSSLSFTREEWDNEPSIYDEMLLESAIRKINSRIIYLFDYYYDRW